MGPFPTEDAARQAYNNALPPDLVIVPGSEDVAATGGGTPSTVYYVVRRVPADYGARPADCAAFARPEQLARGGILAQPGRRRPIRPADRAEHQPATRDHSRQPCVLGADHSVAHHRRGADHRRLRPAAGAGPGAGPSQRRVARADGLPRRADGRAVARRRFDSRGRHGVDRRPRAGRAVHAGLLQARRASTR